MKQKKDNRGGARQGAGRHKTGRDFQVCLKLSKEAYDTLKQFKNRSAYIDELIKQHKVKKAGI